MTTTLLDRTSFTNSVNRHLRRSVFGWFGLPEKL